MPSGPAGAVEKALTNENEFLDEWMRMQLNAGTLRADLMKESELRSQSRELISLLRVGVGSGSDDVNAVHWADARDYLANISRSRALQGFSPTETATFVLSIKQPLFMRLRRDLERSPAELAEALWFVITLVDKLGLFTTDAFLRSREEVINRQQQELLELSTPVVQLWDGVLALPLIGTLDSARTQVVMENLLHSIVRTGAAIAIIDITGVPTVDTLVAQHLLKTVAAARLMGADCIISGIRPQIAQTIVHLGVNLSEVTTKATLADAFLVALKRTNSSLVRNSGNP